MIKRILKGDLQEFYPSFIDDFKIQYNSFIISHFLIGKIEDALDKIDYDGKNFV